jgi:outer membrane protein TolC
MQLKQLEQNVLIQIENDIAVANTRFQQVDATREARIYAEAALDAEQKKLESGKSTSFVVLQLTKDLTTARSTEISALASYNNALAQLALDEGDTLERRHVSLEIK